LVEHLLWEQGVVGSNPTIPMFSVKKIVICGILFKTMEWFEEKKTEISEDSSVSEEIINFSKHNLK
jgi:hypothetical protein